MVKAHQLKCWPPVFHHVATGKKTFEYRKNDRGFLVGDILCLSEYLPVKKIYTGKYIMAKVVYIVYGGQFGIPSEYCIMGIKCVPNYSVDGRITRRYPQKSKSGRG